ncbi:MAG: 4a-hydroxytetrahydrobiopterin dehydratase [Patescibacteria group bacterium]
MQKLHQKKCEVCRVGMPTLSNTEAAKYLGELLGWKKVGRSIKKSFAFKNFKEALVFFNAVAEVAETEGHHPDMSIYKWKYVKLSLTTHAARGLTPNDFIVAAKADLIFKTNHS